MSENRIIYVPVSKPMSEAEIRAALAQLPAESEPWRAILQIVTEQLSHTIVQTANQRLAAEERAHAAGQMDQCLLLRSRLEELHAK